MKVALLLSGGLDSAVAYSLLLSVGHEVVPVVVDYGQRAKMEVVVALYVADIHGAKPVQVRLSNALEKSPLGSLTDADGNCVVRQRNLMLLTLAAACVPDADAVAIGVTRDDSPDYYDCSRSWLDSAEAALGVRVMAPLIDYSKRDVLRLGRELGAPVDRTWSCYSAGLKECGKCAACVRRAEAVSAP